MAAEAEAKQLDSVTDVVKEAEIDASKAQRAIQQAISAVRNSGTAKKDDDNKIAALAVSKDDVELIVAELEVTEDEAARALREVLVEAKEKNLVEAALSLLMHS